MLADTERRNGLVPWGRVIAAAYSHQTRLNTHESHMNHYLFPVMTACKHIKTKANRSNANHTIFELITQQLRAATTWNHT